MIEHHICSAILNSFVYKETKISLIICMKTIKKNIHINDMPNLLWNDPFL